MKRTVKLVNITETKEYDVYIGRGKCPNTKQPSIWKNIFEMDNPNFMQRKMACVKYEKYLRENEELLSQLPTLVGKTLGCWCVPDRCHGEVIIKIMRERGLID